MEEYNTVCRAWTMDDLVVELERKTQAYSTFTLLICDDGDESPHILMNL